jgi:copper resistance protein B
MRQLVGVATLIGLGALLPAVGQAEVVATGGVAATDPGGAEPAAEPQGDRVLNNRTLGGAAPYGTPISDDRLYVHGIFNQLEGRLNGDTYLRWEGQAWIGNDYNKLWLKSEARYNADNKHKVGDGDQELLYDRAISRFYNVQAGVRYDLDSKPGRVWGAVGIHGLSVGFFNLEATAYVSGDSRFALKTNASWDFRFTQRLMLQPQFETNWYTKSEQVRGVGSGLSDIDSGLRLRYEISRKFAPYIGVSYQQFFGKTADMKRVDGSSTGDVRALIGLRTWF